MIVKSQNKSFIERLKDTLVSENFDSLLNEINQKDYNFEKMVGIFINVNNGKLTLIPVPGETIVLDYLNFSTLEKYVANDTLVKNVKKRLSLVEKEYLNKKALHPDELDNRILMQVVNYYHNYGNVTIPYIMSGLMTAQNFNTENIVSEIIKESPLTNSVRLFNQTKNLFSDQYFNSEYKKDAQKVIFDRILKYKSQLVKNNIVYLGEAIKTFFNEDELKKLIMYIAKTNDITFIKQILIDSYIKFPKYHMKDIVEYYKDNENPYAEIIAMASRLDILNELNETHVLLDISSSEDTKNTQLIQRIFKSYSVDSVVIKSLQNIRKIQSAKSANKPYKIYIPDYIINELEFSYGIKYENNFSQFADQLVELRAARKNNNTKFLIEKKNDIIVQPAVEIQSIINDSLKITV